jgi:hypothetical protein
VTDAAGTHGKSPKFSSFKSRAARAPYPPRKDAYFAVLGEVLTMKRPFTRVAALAAVTTVAVGALGADHIDAPATTAEPAADITDIYAWMSSDGKKVELALDVSPFATDKSKFSDAVQYAIHVNSGAGYGKAQTETLVICQFTAAQQIECWVGADEHLSGDASDPAGLKSASGKVKVFAGLRNDPFFFELDGFKKAVTDVEAAASGLTFDTSGCPVLPQAVSAALVGDLTHEPNGTAAKDTFAGANVLAIVLEIDKTLLTSGGATLGVWASTHQKS